MTRWCILLMLFVGVFVFPGLPELWSEEEVSADLVTGLNMLASGLICALSGGAGGGTNDSLLFWENEDKYD